MRLAPLLLPLIASCATLPAPAPEAEADDCRRRIAWCQSQGSQTLCIETEAACDDERVQLRQSEPDPNPGLDL